MHREPASWWKQETDRWSHEEKNDWRNFKRSFYKRFIPPSYLDQKKQEFTNLKQKKLCGIEYYRKFTDLSIYDAETAANPAEMLRRFKLSAKKKWHTLATILPCETYQEFYEIMLRVEDSENMSSDNEEDEAKGSNQMRHDKGKGQLSQGARQTQSFKKSGNSYTSSSRGFNAIGQRRVGRHTGGPGFQLVQVHRCAICAITDI